MKSVSTFAIAASILAGGAVLAVPAAAQDQTAQAAAQPAQWAPKISKEEGAALQPLQAAIGAQDWAAATAALPAAQAAVTSPDGRYYVGQFQFRIGTGTNNAQLQAQGLDAMIASGGGDPSKAALLYKNRGALAVQAQDFAKAEAAYERWIQLAPNDPQAQIAIAEVKFRQNKPQEAFPLMERAMAARRAAGEPIPENWYLLALQSAIDAKMTPQMLTLSRGLIESNPNASNWRNGLLIYRQSTDLDPAMLLDTLRLMRAVKALDRSDEYLSLADLLYRGNYYAEAKAVLDEAAAAGKVPSSNANAAAIAKAVTGKIAEDRAALPGLEARARSSADGELAVRLADGYYGHGNFAKAAEFYRLGVEKGSVDANLINMRLGMALALAGRKAEAEAAFKAVTGPRADLASYWMLWLDQRA